MKAAWTCWSLTLLSCSAGAAVSMMAANAPGGETLPAWRRRPIDEGVVQDREQPATQVAAGAEASHVRS